MFRPHRRSFFQRESVSRSNSSLVLKSKEQIEGMRIAGALAFKTLEYAISLATPGTVSEDLDAKVATFIRDHKALAATLNYKGFPKSTCLSPNDVICHGIAGKWRLNEGDILGIDVTVILNGFYGDTCATVAVGEVSPRARALMQTTLETLRRGIYVVHPDARLGDIGDAIQRCAEPLGYGVVRDFVGHGVGTKFHEEPQVPHFGRAGEGRRLKPGMTFTIEPMINEGSYEQVTDPVDGWTARTIDGKLSAQYEHTIAVTDDGFRILTLPEGVEGRWVAPGGYLP